MENDTPNPSLDSAFDSAFEVLDTVPDGVATESEEIEKESILDSEPEKQDTEDLSDIPEEDIEETEEEAKADDEESFTDVDPSGLTGEALEKYKLLQADYTRKRQEESKQLKQLQKELADIKGRLDQPEEANPNETPEERYKRLARETWREEQEKAFDETAQKEYPNINRRLKEDTGYYDPYLDNWLRSQLTDELQNHINDTDTKIGFDYKEVARQKIKEWDQYMLSANKAYLQRQRELAKSKSKDIKKSQSPGSKPQVKSKDLAPKDIEGAIENAFSQVIN